jgi:hypothetical protein
MPANMKIVSENAARIIPQPSDAPKTNIISVGLMKASNGSNLVSSIMNPTAQQAAIKPIIVGKAFLLVADKKERLNCFALNH